VCLNDIPISAFIQNSGWSTYIPAGTYASVHRTFVMQMSAGDTVKLYVKNYVPPSGTPATISIIAPNILGTFADDTQQNAASLTLVCSSKIPTPIPTTA
jgi:hypothetical protein